MKSIKSLKKGVKELKTKNKDEKKIKEYTLKALNINEKLVKIHLFTVDIPVSELYSQNTDYEIDEVGSESLKLQKQWHEYSIKSLNELERYALKRRKVVGTSILEKIKLLKINWNLELVHE